MAFGRKLAMRGLRAAIFGLFGLALVACDIASGPVSQGPRINTGKPVRIALLVPAGSGQEQQDALADSLVKAARLAISDLGDVPIDLRVYATAGQAEQAANVARQAVSEGAKIIVGPLFAEAANAAGVAVAGKGINVLSFSNNTEIAGGNVFVLGNTFENTANRLVGYAARNGLRNIAVIARQNAAGELGTSAVVRAAARAGANFTGVATYEFTPQAVISAIPAIKSQVVESGSDAVVFTSDTAGALPVLAQLLPENGLRPDRIQFIGLTRWDIPAATLSQQGLQGGWFALPDRARYAGFTSRYTAAYGAPPHPLAGVSYDAIAAVGALLKSGESDALTRNKLTQPQGFIGVNGVFRLLSDGTNERGLAIAEIQDGAITIIDPAPRGFAAAGL
jgi:substrate-binding family protein